MTAADFGKLLAFEILVFQFFGSIGTLALGDGSVFWWFGGLCLGIVNVGAALIFLSAFFADKRSRASGGGNR